ncbi:MAG: OmpA family protein [Gammaproteobacteria bacterium]|nr:OmpA family protein [Gammaproteobacteria bacterium]
MLNVLLSTFVVGLCIFASAVEADMRRYSGSLENSKWQLTTETKLQCDLIHEIPNYGHAVFSAEASKMANLAFELDIMRLPADYSLANIESVPPRWKPGTPSKPITTMQWRKQFNGDVDEKSAWVMLTELEKGNFPTLYYTDWHNRHDRVAVSLSATNFADNYYKFLSCVDKLLPYSFDDIAQLTLNFEFGGAELDKDSKNKLAQVREYLKHDKEIESITVKAYSDSFGGRWHNLQVSKKRAAEIKQFFVNAGVAADKIDVEGFGERRHIASNQTELGREENRRVVVQMSKP